MSPNKECQAQVALFKTFSDCFVTAEDNVYLHRAIYDQVQALASEAPGVSYEDTVIPNGIPCKWIRPESASMQHIMLFMHGGGYKVGFSNGHRKLAAHIAKACIVQALSVDYRRTPENSFPAALDDCVAAYKWLLGQGYKSEHIITCGDSCGGALCTSVPLAAMQLGLPLPAAVVSLSPWCDLTMSGDAVERNEDNDVLNTRPFLASFAESYTAGETELKDPLVSPLFASEAQVRGLPPHWISACGYDQLLDDATRFADIAKKAGVEVKLDVHEGQQHVMEFMVGKAPEANTSIREIGAWVREKLVK